MFQLQMAALRPLLSVSVLRAGIADDPATIFIYVLLLLVLPWVFWKGFRTSGKVSDEESSEHGDEPAPPRSPTGDSKAKRKKRQKARKKRDPHRINWIG